MASEESELERLTDKAVDEFQKSLKAQARWSAALGAMGYHLKQAIKCLPLHSGSRSRVPVLVERSHNRKE